LKKLASKIKKNFYKLVVHFALTDKGKGKGKDTWIYIAP